MKTAKKALTMLLVFIMTINILVVAAPADKLATVNAETENVEVLKLDDIKPYESRAEEDTATAEYPVAPMKNVSSEEDTYTFGDLKYIIESGEIVIVGCDEAVSGKVEIPARIDGTPVTAIGDYAFAGCKGITQVVLPGSVTAIGNCAFFGCENLGSINVKAGVSVGIDAFRGCADTIVIGKRADGMVTAMGGGSIVDVSEYNAQTATTFSSALLKTLKNALAKQSSESIYISSYKVPVSQVEDLIDALEEEYPVEFAAAGVSGYGYGYYSDMILADISFYYSSEALSTGYTTRYNKLMAKINPVMDAMEGMNTYEKLLYAHDYLVLNAAYDLTYSRYTAYDILVNGTAVCQGYTLAYQMLMKLCDIPCLNAPSDSMNHIWNIVKIDGAWYHVDTTWDDPVPDAEGRVYYTHFMLTDAEITAEDHEGWVADYKCTSTKYSNTPRGTNFTQYYYNGRWYVYNESAGTIVSYNVYGADAKTVATGATGGIAVYNGILYYGSGESIISLGLNSGKKSTLYTLTSSELSWSDLSTDNDIYSIYISDDGVLSYTYTIWLSIGGGWYQGYYVDGDSTINVASKHDYTLSTPTLEAHSVGYTSAKLTWTKSSAIADGYSIFRSDSADGTYSFVTNVSSSATTYTNTGLSTGKTYYFKVRAYKNLDNDSKVYSGYSNYASARPIPATPVVTAIRSSATIATLSWAKIYGATGYAVFRSDSKNGMYTYIGSAASGDTPRYTNTGLSAAKTYYYKVRAYCQVGADKIYSEYSTAAVASITPEKPYNIVNVVSGIHVYWKAIDGAQKYGLWRSETGVNGTYKWVANPTTWHFTDTNVESGKTYYYKVTVMDTATNTHSSMSEATGITYVATPDITSRFNKAAGVSLGWNKITGATGYAIYRKSFDGNDAWVRIATIEGNSTFTWIDTSVKNNNGTVYRYTVRALAGSNMKTLSGCRNTGRTMARLNSRTLSSVAKTSATSIKCTWTTTTAATGYEVRFMVGDEVYKTYTIGNYKTGAKTFTGLPSGKTYKIQVRSYKKVDGVGSFYSAWSTEKYVTL